MAEYRAAYPLLIVLAVSAGCGSTARTDTRQIMDGFQMNETDMRLAFGRRHGPKVADRSQYFAYVNSQVRRLTGPAWEEAWLGLSTMGQPVVATLIPLLDDPQQTYADRNARPGVANPFESPNLTLGELVYGLLHEMITKYSDYRGMLPGPERASWEAWWKRNGGSIRMSARVVTKGDVRN